MAIILITGASGFIGRYLVNHLKPKHKVISYSRTSSNIKGIKEINDDIVNIDKYPSLLKGVSQVYHLAACINFSRAAFKESIRVNLLGTHKLLKLCRQIKINKFVFISAGATLGFAPNSHQPVRETSKYIPPKYHSYAYSKHLAEKEVLKFAPFFKVIVVNPSTVYDFDDLQGTTGPLVKLINNNHLPVFFPGGTSYIDIDDLITGLTQAMKLGKSQNRYILSTENLTYRQLVNRIAKVLGKNKIKFILPTSTFYPLMACMKIFELACPSSKFLNSNMLAAFYQYRYFNTNKAKKQLKFFPKHKLEDSIKKYTIRSGH